MKALVLENIGHLVYKEAPTPKPSKGEVLLHIRASGICGSDIARVYQKGAYSMPMILGHEFAGEIVEIGAEIDTAYIGKKATVFPLRACMACEACLSGEYAVCKNYNYYGSRCDGGFAEYCAIDARNLVFLDDSVPFELGALAEPATVALHALRRGKIEVGDFVGIAGAGPIGLMLASWANLCGAKHVTLWDIDSAKVDFAIKNGFDAIDSKKMDPIDYAFTSTNGRGYDLSIEGAGVAPTLAQCILSAKPMGRVVTMGNPASDIALPQKTYWEILRRQLTVTGTWNSDFSSFRRNEWSLTVSALANGTLKIKPFITHRYSLSDGMLPFEMINSHTKFYNKVMYII